jgi:hypothetical protein
MFFSILIYSIIEYFIYGHKYDNFIFAKTATLFMAPLIFVAGCIIIDILLGGVFMNGHILVYALAIIAGQYLSYYFMHKEYYFKLMNAYGMISIIVMLGLFLNFSNPNGDNDFLIFKSMDTYKTMLFSNK